MNMVKAIAKQSYQLQSEKKAKFHVVEYRDPETGQLHKLGLSGFPRDFC